MLVTAFAGLIAILLGLALTPHASAIWLAICLGAALVLQGRYLDVLLRWLENNQTHRLPHGYGGWTQVFDRLDRFMQSQKALESQPKDNHELTRLLTAVNQLPDALVVLDKDFQVAWSNTRAQEVLGVVPLNRSIFNILRTPDFIEFAESNDKGRELKLSLPNKPGEIFEVLFIETSEDFKLLVLRNVTDRERLDSMRKDFVANVSHEIRTPLTVVAGFAEALIDQDFSDIDQKKYLELIRVQADTMRQLVDDLLTLSTLESAQRPPLDELVDLSEIAATELENIQSLSSSDHQFTLHASSPIIVRGQRKEIATVLRNLLTNAVRYTPSPGSISLTTAMNEVSASLTVNDSGIGIAEEQIPRLTERFYRVDKGRSRANGGTGLGLAIVKHIAIRHDARLEIKSQPGVGSAFALIFPAHRVLALSQNGNNGTLQSEINPSRS